MTPLVFETGRLFVRVNEKNVTGEEKNFRRGRPYANGQTQRGNARKPCAHEDESSSNIKSDTSMFFDRHSELQQLPAGNPVMLGMRIIFMDGFKEAMPFPAGCGQDRRVPGNTQYLQRIVASRLLIEFAPV